MRREPGGVCSNYLCDLPRGSKVDVTKGTLLLKTDTGSLTVFGGGVSANFKLLRGTDGKRSIVELRLTKGVGQHLMRTWPTSY